MLKKNIKYTDYNGVERSEDFYFNLSKAELMEMEYSIAGGLSESVKKIITTLETPAIIDIFKKIILKAYGEKSPDGKYFNKIDANGNPLSVAFSQTEAYSVLFTELASNDEEAINFIKGVLPKGLKVDEENIDMPENIKKLIDNK